METPYLTPPGSWDEHYYYIFDFSGGLVTPLFPAGSNAIGRSIQTFPDSDFILRRIFYTGAPGGTTFQFYYPNSNNALFDFNPLVGLPFPQSLFGFASGVDTWQSLYLTPELLYPGGSSIVFDAYNIQYSTNGGGEGGASTLYSQLAFQGVRRFRGRDPYLASYPYRLAAYTYRATIALNFGYYQYSGGVPVAVQPPRRFQVPINTGYDFELHALYWSIDGNSGGGPEARIRLFEPLSRRPFTNLFPPDTNGFLDGLHNAGNNEPYASIVPRICYPVNTAIEFEIQSMDPANPPNKVIEIAFTGQNRIPC